MTEPSPHPHIQLALTAQTNSDSLLPPEKPPIDPKILVPPQQADEDDSTIKCICGFKHDDGSSVFCEKCETWQHTECYYYDEKNDRVLTTDELNRISHFCTDCDPRTLDVQAAIHRQKNRLGGFDHDDRKAKKAATKTHKKRATKGAEVNGVLANGWSPDAESTQDRTSRSPRDPLTSTKKPKSHHRPSQSLAISGFSQFPTSHPHKRSASALQSPTKAIGKHNGPPFLKTNFSTTFMHLYDNDAGDQSLRTNLHSSISITDALSTWAVDIDALHEATRGFSHADVFHRIELPLEDIMGSPPRKQTKEEVNVMVDGRHPRWIFLTSDGFTKRNTIVGELKGKIGHMKDYTSDPQNNWDWLRHPVPFVFFHPKLPIYIDTRSEGTTCRYLRRSCCPNLSMTTILENETDYHFCFTAKEDIEPGTELTIGWTLDEHMRKFSSNKNGTTQDSTADGEEYCMNWVGKVSSEFGGCACGVPETCWFVKYDPEYRALPNAKSYTNRRKAAPNPQDSSDAEESGSTSRSNSGSRALTPSGSNVGAMALGLDISEREKRKIALLEKNLDNDKHQPPAKRKKRNSGGSSTHNPGAQGTYPKQLGQPATSVSLPNTPGLNTKPHYVDNSTSGRKSNSPTAKVTGGIPKARTFNDGAPSKKGWSHPNTPTNSSPLRTTYVSTAVQTELDTDADWSAPLKSSNGPRRPFMSMTRRLLIWSQRDRQILDERRRSVGAQRDQQHEISHQAPADTSRRWDEQSQGSDAQGFAHPGGAEPDVRLKQAPNNEDTSPPHAAPAAPPWPTSEQNGGRRTELRVQLPPKPTQPSDSILSTPLTQTPTSSVPMSPCNHNSLSHPPHLQPSIAGNVHPSPVKKKVSLQLSDYLKRKGSHSTDGKRVVGSPDMVQHTLKPPPPPSSHGDPSADGSALVDTPKKEVSDPMEVEEQQSTVVSPIKEEARSQP